MKIQRLYIGDFGILRNQTLDELGPGIVVIGGLNRAGKSTLMHVLRHLGYGFPRDSNLPPANSRYEAEADIRLGAGDVYNLRLKGYGEPILKRITGLETDISAPKDLYGLDSFSYNRLFTITLDELSINRGISDEDKMRLQSILLGAGFSEMLLLPQLERDFYREGDSIGGKRGNPGVKQFRPYSSIIEAGRKLKQRGLSQIGEYQDKQQELQHMDELAEALNNDIKELDNLIVQLDIIKNSYGSYLRVQELKTWLDVNKDQEWEDGPREHQLERIESLREEYIGLCRKLREKELQSGLTNRLEESLLGVKEEMADLLAGISGVYERMRGLGQRKQELDRKRRDIILKAGEANAHWGETDIDYITRIKADNVEHNRLNELVEEYRELEYRKRTQADILQRAREEAQAFKDRTAEDNDGRPWIGIKKYFYFSLILTLLGMALSMMNPLLGLIVGVGGTVGAALFLIMKTLGRRTDTRAAYEQEKELRTRQAKVRAEQGILEQLESNLRLLEETLNDYKAKLGLPERASHSALPGHLLRIRDIQTKAAEVDWLLGELDDTKKLIGKQYVRYKKFLDQFCSGEPRSSDGRVDPCDGEEWNRISHTLKLWADRLKDAEELGLLRDEKAAIRRDIMDMVGKYDPADPIPEESNARSDCSGPFDSLVLDFIERAQDGIVYAENKAFLSESIQSIAGSMSSDGIRRAFIPESADRADLLKAFIERCQEYASVEEADREYSMKMGERGAKLDELDGVKEAIRKLRDDLERLGAVENLTLGQRQIDSGKAELKVLADQYAVNMTSAFLLREAEKNLLEGMKDSVMKSAGIIFNRMTGGHYHGILPSEPLLESDFQAVPDGDGESQTIDMLSRGTREQLYLSVRLSRIMDIKPCLPIIIDDSFANFDSIHLNQSIDILSELAKTHQIFILTCHGELVGRIAESGCCAQYWKLERGKLKVTDCDELSDHLWQ
ncbi:MAG TPA: AAA family ATPase [Clostridia bacterium]|nr:AAA family ATPase [Clostridia bacterium]